jgi:hypothetical protein
MFRPNVPLQVSGTQSDSGEIHIKTATLLGQSVCGAETVTLDWSSALSNRNMTGTLIPVTSGWYPDLCLQQSFTVVGGLTAISRAADREANR